MSAAAAARTDSRLTGRRLSLSALVGRVTLVLEVTPIIEDQQVVTPTVTYWEGASLVTRDATGRAYVELTGYCR